MRTLATVPPIPYRHQNGGDYLIPSMQLRPGLDDSDATGFAIHQRLSPVRNANEKRLRSANEKRQ